MAAWRASGRRSSVRRGGGGPPGALSHKAILERPVGDSCRIVTPADRAFDNVGPMGGDPRRSALTAAMAIDLPPLALTVQAAAGENRWPLTSSRECRRWW